MEDASINFGKMARRKLDLDRKKMSAYLFGHGHNPGSRIPGEEDVLQNLYFEGLEMFVDRERAIRHIENDPLNYGDKKFLEIVISTSPHSYANFERRMRGLANKNGCGEYHLPGLELLV
jgi:hypothetical protein